MRTGAAGLQSERIAYESSQRRRRGVDTSSTRRNHGRFGGRSHGVRRAPRAPANFRGLVAKAVEPRCDPQCHLPVACSDGFTEMGELGAHGLNDAGAGEVCEWMLERQTASRSLSLDASRANE